MFDPSIGRWTQEDPIEFEAGDRNLYRSVRNNTTNATDPSGLAPPEKLQIMPRAIPELITVMPRAHWTEAEVVKLLKAVPVGRETLKRIKDHNIIIMRADNLRWERIEKATGKVAQTWGSKKGTPYFFACIGPPIRG